MKKIVFILCAFVVFASAHLLQPDSTVAAGAEYVWINHVDDLNYTAIIERRNGEQYFVEYGIGCLSLWHYQDKQVVITSPGLFAGVGAKIVLPDRDQSCRIWQATLLNLMPTLPTTPLLPILPSIPSEQTEGQSSDGPELENLLKHLESKPNVEPFQNTANASSIPGVFFVGSEVVVFVDQGRAEEMDVTPFIENDRVFVPVRFLAYLLDVPEQGIMWHQDSSTVILVKDRDSLALTVGSNTMLVNFEEKILDVEPILRDQRVFLPARWVAEAFGYNVEWNPSVQGVAIYR